MNWFSHLKLKYKFGLVLVLIILGFSVFALSALSTINKVEINGDLYKQIVNGKDLIADILPPPDYIVETHLVCFQMLNEYDKSVLAELYKKAKTQREEFEARQKVWRELLPEDQMKKDMVENSYKPAVEYFDLRDSKFIPLIQNDQRDEAKTLLLGAMKEKYDIHRSYIDKVVEKATEKNAEVEASASEIISSSLLQLIIIGVIVFILATVIIVITSQKITSPVKKLQAAAETLATGDINVTVKSEYKDELGELENSFSKMLENIKHSSLIAEEIAAGNLKIKIEPKSDKDVLVTSLKRVAENINKLVMDVNLLSSSAIDGKLSVRADKDKHQGEYKDVVEGFNKTLDAIYSPFSETIKTLQLLATNDLTARMDAECKGDYSTVKNAVNTVAETLNNTITKISNAIQATASAAQQISSSTEELATGAQEQSAQSQDVAAAVEQMTRTIYETSKNTSAAADASKNAGSVAKEGGKVVSETIEGMNRIAEVVQISAQTVQELGKSSEQIGEIAQVIDDIADQTNLLALNAAIEAARAGEQGRGFAVVADEVRKLAERTTKATKEIAQMIKQIQKDTGNAVDSMRKGIDEVENGKVLAVKAGDSLTHIIQGAENVVDLVAQVAAASEEQSSASEQISKNIESISNVASESASGIQQIAHATEDLTRLTVNLQELIDQFKINSDSSNLAVRQNGKLIKL